MPFRPMTLPLVQGLSQDQSAHAVMPGGLRTAHNVVFTRKGALAGRPAAVTHQENVQTSSGTANVTLASAVGARAQAGVVAVNTPGGERPLSLYQGLQLLHQGSQWRKVGTSRFARKSVSASMAEDTLLRGSGGTGGHVAPLSAGTNVFGPASTKFGARALPYLDNNNELLYYGTSTASGWDSASTPNHCAAGNAVFYHNQSGDVYVHLAGSLPVTTDVLVGAALARNDTVPRMNIAAVQDGTAYFIAFAGAAAGTIGLRRINSAGAVTATLNLAGAGTVHGVSLAINSASRLCLAWVDTATSQVKTKVFTTTAATITDAAIDVNYGSAATTNPFSVSFAVGTSHLGTALVAYLSSTGDMVLGERSYTAATSSTILTLHGFTDAVSWEPLFNPMTVGDMTVMGVQRVSATQDFDAGTSDYNVGQAQWFVLNLTELLNTPGTLNRGFVLAHGRWRGSARSKPTTAGILAATTGIAFGVWEGSTFDTLGTADVRATRVLLELSPAAHASTTGGGLLSSANALLFDGQSVRQHPFPETYPDIVGVNSVAGGGLAAGSYTYQATWEMIDAGGRVIRSGSSIPVTVGAVVLNNKVEVVIALPQLPDFASGGGSATWYSVKLWATDVNPSAGAPLYFVGQSQQFSTTTTSVQIDHSAVDTTQEQLYTVGDVLDDEPPPAGDRGVALAIERAWVADQRAVYASKLLRERVAPAWSTSEQFVINMPTALGDIQGLAGYDDRLMVICSNGVAIVRGPGYDDLGLGGGWATDVFQGQGAGTTHPRRVVATTDGVVYEGRAGGLWVVDVAGNRQRINTPMAVSAYNLTGDISVGGGTSEDRVDGPHFEPRRLYHGTMDNMAVYDFDVQQWATWIAEGAGTYHCTVNGTLWAQAAATLHAMVGTPGQDEIAGASVDVDMSIVTGPIQPTTESPYGWGRLRKVQIHGRPPNTGTPYVITMLVTGDDGVTLMSDIENYTPAAVDGLWPNTPFPEFTTSIQRCRFFTVSINIAPGDVEITSLEFWVSGGNEAPVSNRT